MILEGIESQTFSTKIKLNDASVIDSPDSPDSPDKKLATPKSARGKHTPGTTRVTDYPNNTPALSHTKLLWGCNINVPIFFKHIIVHTKYFHKKTVFEYVSLFLPIIEIKQPF